MNKLSLTKKILATACAVAGLTFVGGSSEAADVDNQKSVLKPQNTLNIINDMNMCATNPYFESINVVNSENSQVLKQIRNDKVSVIQDNNFSQTNGVFGLNNVSASAGVSPLMRGDERGVQSREGLLSLNQNSTHPYSLPRKGGQLTGAAAPTLDTMKTDATEMLPTASTYFGATYELTEITDPSMDLTGKTVVAFNGKRYYYDTPTTLTNEKANMLNYLSGSTSVALTSTGATAANAVFKTVINDETTYYTFDTTKLPVSAYTGTTYSDFAFKSNPTDIATFENGASGNYDVKVSFDKDHTKYYNINIDPTKASSVGSKLSSINWSTTDPYSDPDKWEDYYSAGSKVTVGSSTITGAIRMKMSHNGSVPESSSWNKYFTYTYTKPTDYAITQTRLDDNVTADNVNKKVFAGITHEYDYNGAAIYNTKDLSAINITADFIGNYTWPNGTGGAIYNDSGAKIGSIVGNFIGNHSYFYGGAIGNGGTIGSIIGDFVGNSTVFNGDGTVGGGAIYNGGTISSITGDFIGNFAYSATSSYGGAISNEGTISRITGDFIGNNASSDSANGGAIANNHIIGSITGDFIGNSASDSSYAYGGAILVTVLPPPTMLMAVRYITIMAQSAVSMVISSATVPPPPTPNPNLMAVRYITTLAQ